VRRVDAGTETPEGAAAVDAVAAGAPPEGAPPGGAPHADAGRDTSRPEEAA
jgi:hypothetical protein